MIGDAGDMSEGKIRAIEARAEIRQIKTMADGSVNVVLNLPEDCREQIKVLLDWIGQETRVMVALPSK